MQTTAGEISLHVSVATQTLVVRGPSGEPLHRYPVSTSRYGLGSEPGSQRTPTGFFRIAEKIGGDALVGTVFKSRVPTGEIGLHATDDDLVLTRILWLDGLEPRNANTYERYIYIHGTNHESRIGQPASHGCVRMRNADVVELYVRVEIGTKVTILAA